MSAEEFLSCSPREFDLLLQDEIEQTRDRIYPAALICSVIANVNRDAEKRPEPWRPADFMPGAKTEEDEMREFVEAIQRGDTFETDPEDLERFKWQMKSSFKNIVTPGEIVRTNAVAGDGTRRGLN